MTKTNQVYTPEFRVSFPEVFQPKAVNAGDKEKYSIQMIFRIDASTANPGEKVADLGEMGALLAQTAAAKWGADKTQWPANLKFPFRKGEEKKSDGYGAGTVFCSASTIERPGIVNEQNKPILMPSDFYAGCYAIATLNAYAWTYMGKSGVSFGLRNIQKVRDGDPFSGKNRPENDFKPIPGAAAAPAAPVDAPVAGVDPLAGLR